MPTFLDFETIVITNPLFDRTYNDYVQSYYRVFLSKLLEAALGITKWRVPGMETSIVRSGMFHLPKTFAEMNRIVLNEADVLFCEKFGTEFCQYFRFLFLSSVVRNLFDCIEQLDSDKRAALRIWIIHSTATAPGTYDLYQSCAGLAGQAEAALKAVVSKGGKKLDDLFFRAVWGSLQDGYARKKMLFPNREL